MFVALRKFHAAPRPGASLRKFVESAAAPTGVDLEKRQATFICSDSSADRDGDTLDVTGWKLANYKNNGVLLYAHDSRGLPVGKCIGIGVEGGQLKATFQFAKHQLAQDVFEMVADGTLKAVSVGFKPTKWVQNGERRNSWGGAGIDFKEQELLEVSVVPVPANPNALLDSGKAARVLEVYAKGYGHKDDGEDDADDVEAGAHDLMAKMQAHCDTLEGHATKFGQLAGRKEAAVKRLEAAVKSLEAGQLTDDPGAGDDGKGAKSARVLSAKNYKALKAAHGHVKSVLDDHEGAHGADDEGDEDPPEPADDDKAGPTFDAWLKELAADPVKAAALQDEINARVDAALKKSRGRLPG